MSPVWMPSRRISTEHSSRSTRSRKAGRGLARWADRRGAWKGRAGARTIGLLAMRWLVDGMNVIGTRPDAWWKDRHAAMVRLVDMLERWAATNGEDVTVVFEQPPSPPIRPRAMVVGPRPRD